MAVENVVIAYTADINDIISKVKSIQQINTIAAKQLGAEFTKNINIVSNQLKKVQFDKSFKIRADDGEIKKVTGTVNTFEKVLTTADGKVFKFSETLGTAEGQTVPLSSSIQAVNSKANTLIGTSSKLATNFSSLTSVNQRFSKQLQGFGSVSQLVGTSLNQVSDSGSRVAKIFQTADGRFVKLTETVKRLPNGVQQVNRSIQELSKSQADNAKVLERSNTTTKTFRQNIADLAKRAALTIPVWFALRNSVSSVFRTIRDGLGDIVTFDRALQKLRRNIEATSTNIERDFANIRDEIVQFSLRTGKSVEDVTNAIQKFATVGFDLETSLKGGLQATELSILLFGDAEETADAFARSLRVMTEGIGDSATQQQVIGEALALTAKLWQTNNFEIGEATQNLEKFAGVAKIANLSINETLSLLAALGTAGVGNRAGRLLRSTLLKSLGDIEKVTRGLNLQFDPTTQPTIEFILQMVSALKELRTEGRTVPAELAETLGELFSVRGTEVISALTALESTLRQNLALQPDVDEFEASVERMLGTVGSLAEQFTNANREIGKAFVTGIVGGDDFDDTLKKIVQTQLQILANAERMGTVFRDVFVSVGAGGLAFFVQRLGIVSLSIASLTTALTRLRALALAPLPPVLVTAVLTFTILRFKDEAERLAREAEAQAQTFNDIGAELAKNINLGLRKELSTEALRELIIELETFGADVLQADPAQFEKTLSVLREILNTHKEITKEQEEQQKIQPTEGQREQIAENVLKLELDLLKARGATNSQLIQAEQLGRKRLDIEQGIIDQINTQLEKEKAITEERRLRADVGNEELRLFRIAQTEGTDVARRIGDVLAGNLDFSTFVRRGGRELEVFKEQFEDIFESQQARAFFSGSRVPGLPDLRGGSLIETEQQFDTRELAETNSRLLLAQSKSVSLFERLSKEQLRSTNETKNLSQELVDTQVSLESLEQAFRSGAPLFGQQARDVVSNISGREQTIQGVARRVAPQRQIIDLNVNIDGRNVSLTGTPEAVQRLANQAGEEVSRQVQQLINNIANNPQSPEAQAVRRRILEE